MRLLRSRDARAVGPGTIPDVHPTNAGEPGDLQHQAVNGSGFSTVSLRNLLLRLYHGGGEMAYRMETSTLHTGNLRNVEGHKSCGVRLRTPPTTWEDLSELSLSACWVPPLSPLVSSSSIRRVQNPFPRSGTVTLVRVSLAPSPLSASGSSGTDRSRPRSIRSDETTGANDSPVLPSHFSSTLGIRASFAPALGSLRAPPIMPSAASKLLPSPPSSVAQSHSK